MTSISILILQRVFHFLKSNHLMVNFLRITEYAHHSNGHCFDSWMRQLFGLSVRNLFIMYSCELTFSDSIVCCILVQEMPLGKPDSVDPVKNNSSQNTNSSSDSGFPEFPNKTINKRIALVSTLAALGFFLSTRLDLGVSLKDLSATALPYEEVCLVSNIILIVLYWLCIGKAN